MTIIQILPDPIEPRVWYALEGAHMCAMEISPATPAPLAEQVWAVASWMMAEREGEELVVRTLPGIADELADAFGRQAVSGLASTNIRIEIDRGFGWESEPPHDRAIEEAQRVFSLARAISSEPLEIREAEGGFCVSMEGEAFRSAVASLSSLVEDFHGSYAVDAAAGAKRSPTLEALSATRDGVLAAALSERLAGLAVGRTRVVRFDLPTGRTDAPFLAFTLAPDGKAVVSLPDDRVLARYDERAAKDELSGDPAFLLVERGGERVLTYGEIAESRADWGEHWESSSRMMRKTFSERASFFNEEIRLVPLDDATGERLPLTLVFSPDGTIAVERPPLALGRTVDRDAVSGFASRPAPSLDGIGCCGERDLIEAGVLRDVLPAVCVVQGDPLLPERAAGFESDAGLGVLSASPSLRASALLARLRAAPSHPDRMSDLALLWERLPAGTTLAAPSVEEARLLAVAARAAASAKTPAGFDGPRYVQEFEAGFASLVEAGLVLDAPSELRPRLAPSTGRETGEASLPIWRGKLATVAMGGVVEAMREASRTGRPRQPAGVALTLDPDGTLRAGSGTAVGKAVDLSFFASPIGQALDKGQSVVLDGEALLNTVARGWRLEKDASGSPRIALPRFDRKTERMDLAALASASSARVIDGQRPLRPVTQAMVSAFQSRSGLGAASAILANEGRPHDVEAAHALAGLLSWKQSAELRADIGSYAVLQAARLVAEKDGSDARDRLARDLGLMEGSFAERWGTHPDRLLAPVLEAGAEPSRALEALKNDGARMSGVELLAAVAAAERVSAVEGRSPQAVVLSWLGREDPALLARLESEASARVSACAGLEPEHREKAVASVSRQSALTALGLVDPVRFGRAVDAAKRLDQDGLSRCWGVGERVRLQPEPPATAGVSASATRRLLTERLDSGRIGRAEFATALGATIAEAEAAGQRPGDIAARASGLPDIQAAHLALRVKTESDRLLRAAESLSLGDEDRDALKRHLLEREAIRGFGFPSVQEERMLRGWALELHARSKVPTPCAETLHGILVSSRTRPLSVEDVRAMAATASLVGGLEGKPARTVIFEAAERLAAEQEVSSTLNGVQGDSVQTRMALREAMKDVGNEDWKGMRAAGTNPDARAFVEERSAIQAIVAASRALRPGQDRAVSAEVELSVLGRLAEAARGRAGRDVAALVAPALEARSSLRRDAGMGR